MNAPRHATLGPSSAKRWLNCPGSVALTANIPNPPSEYAAQGTVAHAIAEAYASRKATLEQISTRVGEVVKQDGFSIEIDEEMIDGAVDYKEAVDSARTFFEGKGRKSMPVVEKFEARAHAKSVSEAVWGTADHFMYRKGQALYVTDYKFGRRVVNVEENEQLCLYAIGIMDSEAGWALDKVVLRIVQPRAMSGGKTMWEWITYPAWLKEWRDNKARPAALATAQKGAALVAGDWCYANFCSARSVCPAVQAKAAEVAQIDFSVVPAMAAGGLPDIKLLSVTEKAKILLWEDFVVDWFKTIRGDLQSELDAGRDVPGWKLVAGRSNRKWQGEAAVIAEFGAVLGDKLWTKKLVSPSQLEKIAKLKPAMIEHLVFRPEGAKMLAPTGDARPALAASAQVDFDVVAPTDSLLSEL